MSRLPLEGIRVLDLSMWQAGPTVTMVMGDMGAEIVKIEALQRLDGWRGGAGLTENRAYERAPNWNGLNRNKLGLTLDLKHPAGAALFKRLVTVADVVVENYTPRVMHDFGLAYDVLQELNPGLVMISLSGFGATGPWRDFSAFAFPTEEMAGYSQLTGYEGGGPPMLAGHPITDAMAGMMGTFSVLVALEHRRRGGRGQYLDLSQVEALTGLIGEAVVDYSMNGRTLPRIGNRHPWMAPHGVYPTRNAERARTNAEHPPVGEPGGVPRAATHAPHPDDAWVAIAVGTDAQWRALCEAMGRADLADDPRFATLPPRRHNQDELDGYIEEWTRGRSHYEVMHALQQAGIAAGPVLTPAQILSDPHLEARGFFEVLDRAEVGGHPYPGPAFKLSKTPGRLRRPAPLLGEHNDYVLRELLGMPDDELRALASEDVIGTAPLSQAWR
jgi:crotonobetainyl-CoA:carnitine CoA-transferase CaiB-like acyl-CoA transferase